MENPFFNRLGSHLWSGLVILIVLLAIYVSAGRLLTANLFSYRAEILHALNARLPFSIDAEQVSGEWRSFAPDVVLKGLRIIIPGSGSPPLELSQGKFGVDVVSSLRTRSLQMTRLVLDGLTLRGKLSPEGGFELTGFNAEAGQTAEPLREFLLNVERITLRNNRLLLTLPGGEVRDLSLDLQLVREGSERGVQATLVSSVGSRFSIQAQGLGDPFNLQAFSGRVYLAMQSTDLGAMNDMFAVGTLPAWANGAVELQLWSNWDKGKSSLAAQFESRDLLIAAEDDSWQISLQRVALNARLLERDDRWVAYFSDIEVENGAEVWSLPRLQVESRGDALQVRTAEISLNPLNGIIANQPAVPDALREVFTALHPRGQLQALQFSVDDISKPADNWQFEANFQDVAVNSVVGAPGITAATGYTQLAPGGGFVILDSQSISLDFPAIYHEPLYFEDLFGTLRLSWDAQRVTLSSGLLTTQGQEGEAKVLFGLNIPRQADDIGIEMDLLVGLRDTRAVHRVKYVPYILDPGLLIWLADSIGDGYIEQGAFLWRGSLRPGASPLRTVQLAFNVADTHLTYHPQWPPVLVKQGVVLIDDSNVSVWADHASLFESSVDQLSVETRLSPAGHIMLDVRGSLRGPVTDGLKVLNESPLADVVGPTFAAWKATGDLDARLQLHMDLSDSSAAPRVDVVTQWADVQLQVMPGNLGLKSVNGEFVYSTQTGFSSNGLMGTLWGNRVTANLVQHHDEKTARYAPATTVLDIELAGELDIADVRRWLQLDALAFASGAATAELNIRLVPRESPLLTVSSDLLGISLDLPQPWHKRADDPQQLSLEMPLSQGMIPLSLQLGEQLDLRLNAEAGAVNGGTLGINNIAPPVEEGVFRVIGHAPLIQADEWLALIGRSTAAAQSGVSATPASTEPSTTQVTVASSAVGAIGLQTDGPLPLKVAVDELRADTLVIFDQELHDVVLDLGLDRAQWNLSLATDWLRADASRDGDDQAVRLSIEHLDLDRLPDLGGGREHADGDLDTPLSDLPPLLVDLRNLYQSERRLGELQFVLNSEGSVVTVDNISGEIANLRVRSEPPAQLQWHRGPAAFTQLLVNFDFDDLGQTLEYFDYQRIVESVEGGFELEMRWPDAPQDFSLGKAQGSMQVNIDQGSFLEAPAGATGALRVVSILNLADIVQRLSFAKMFESGIPFDSVQGEIHVGDGILKVPHMDVQGGASFQFGGVSNLQNKSLEGELVVTLPVVNNLPWIAALAASLPVAAGVYVVSQVFNKQMNRLSSVVYTIDGSWNDPDINFDRIFDNTPQAPEALAPAIQSAAP